jgi:hypothetical protein
MYMDLPWYTELDFIMHPGMALTTIPDHGHGDSTLDILHISDGASAGDIAPVGLV